MTKIKMNVPLVEMDGDEMTRVLWKAIKEILILPHVDLNTEYYDLGLPERERTADKVTFDAAEAIKKYGVGVKCATITPNAQRVQEYNLTQMWKSPNGTIRAALDGTVFRAPVLVDGIKPLVPNWTKPITIARHAYGDVYSGVEAYVPEGGKVYLELPNGEKKLIKDLPSAGIIQAVHNLDKSIAGFFKDIFREIYDAEYKDQFESAGIEYFYTLIDDAVARVMRSKGGFIWACKNYDGDVMSDMLATAFGSLAMMTSVLVSPDGKYEYEAAHGTVTRHYYKHLNGEATSTNSVATIFAWTGALKKRAELDGNAELKEFAERLEAATVSTIESGIMTGDLVALFHREGVTPKKVGSVEFLEAVAKNL